MNIVKNLVSESKYSIKCPYLMTPEFIVVHNTANDASAQNEVAYMVRNENQVSFHYGVDDKEVVQGLPTNRNAWACGDGPKGNGNRKGIQVEICYSKSGGARFENAEKNAAKFIAKLLKERGWGIDKVKKHQDFSGKYCPHRTLDKGWASFMNMVKDYLNELNTPTQTTNSFKGGDQVKIKSSATTYANSTKSIPSWAKGTTYTVSKASGDKVLLKEITSWVYSTDVELVKATVGATSNQTTTFLVEIICDSLNIRQSDSFDSKVVGTVKKGQVFTITQESNGLYKLKSGVGWISANKKYVQKI